MPSKELTLEDVVKLILKFLSPQKAMMTGVEKQDAYVLSQVIHHIPCPSCGEEVNAFSAAGITEPEHIVPVNLTLSDGPPLACPHCKRPLKFYVPLFGAEPYGWVIDFEKERADAATRKD